ncbi:MAG: PDZ domain-containing protein [Verrucomicrobiales bacterium]|nr:PDZ domain-containing protein [Verrucomicrobiales bacterium]MCP5559070.1 PDZ domain-containing protein [Verrucomicrobiaceae bacterium]
MKTRSILTACLAAGAVLPSAPLRAQEAVAPPVEEVKKPEVEAAKPEHPREKAEKKREHKNEHHAEMKPFVGVMTRSVEAELRAQTKLKDGFGLLVIEVMPGSPASEAGIKVHDILTRFDDQQLVNMEQLMTLVRSRQKGDKVSFVVISGGEEKTIAVTLGEHEVGPEMPPTGSRGSQGWPMGPHHEWMPPQEGNGKEMRERMERFQDRMRAFQDRMQDWVRGGRKGEMPKPPTMDGDAPRGIAPILPKPEREERAELRAESHSEAHSSANVLRRDETGEYRLRREDGNLVFTAKPKDGKEQSWTLHGDQDREQIPEHLRGMLKELEEIHSDLPAPKGDRK